MAKNKGIGKKDLLVIGEKTPVKTYEGIVMINLEYIVRARSEAEVITYLENVEMPSAYQENSFEIIRVTEIKGA